MTNYPRVSLTLAICLAVIGGFGLVGCGGTSAPARSEDVTTPIYDFEDASYDGKAFSSLFTDGSAPANRGDYARLKIELNGEPKVSGKTAKVPIKLTPRTGVTLGEGVPAATAALPKGPVETTWTLEETGDGWKIAEAPLK